MARIRSIHPGLASDEAYMSMSMACKAAWPLLWTECDDHGIFEWKPIVLKARIFPADNVDFAAILAEFESLGCIKRFEIDGKPYGVVRNFGRFQRPKNPSFRHSLPGALSEYAGFKAVDGDNPPPVLPQSSPSPPENPPQMKEEGGNRKDSEGSDEPSSPEPEKSAPVAFEFPCASGEMFPVHEADIAEWSASFPAVDIRQQLAAARSWLVANPTRRKTRRGMRKFIVAWLDRRQNAGGQPPPRSGAPPPRERTVSDALREIAAGTWKPPDQDDESSFSIRN